MNPPFFVAEIGGAHNGQLARAKALIAAAADAGAQAVKLQTYTPRSIAVDRPITQGPWAGRSYHDLYREAMTPWEWHAELFAYARERGMIAFSSPFSLDAVDLLETLDCPIYKIASPEIIYLDLIRKAASTGKPLVISTGMATWTEIAAAVAAAREVAAAEVVLLHCVSAYPARAEDYDLGRMHSLRRYETRVGLSDHSLGTVVAVAAAALGAAMVEKHLTLSRAAGGPDAAFSSEPDEFAAMVRDCRIAAAAMQPASRKAESSSRQYRRSLWVVRDTQAGEPFTAENIGVLRPAEGLHPHELPRVLGRLAKTALPAGTPLQREDVF